MDEWYVLASGQQYGPVSRDVMRDWIAHGRVGPTSLIWRPGLAQWEAAQVHFMFSSGDAAPSAPQPQTPMEGCAAVAGAPTMTYGPIIRKKPGKLKAIAIMTLIAG